MIYYYGFGADNATVATLQKISLYLLKIKDDVFTCKTMSSLEFKIFQQN